MGMTRSKCLIFILIATIPVWGTAVPVKAAEDGFKPFSLIDVPSTENECRLKNSESGADKNCDEIKNQNLKPIIIIEGLAVGFSAITAKYPDDASFWLGLPLVVGSVGAAESTASSWVAFFSTMALTKYNGRAENNDLEEDEIFKTNFAALHIIFGLILLIDKNVDPSMETSNYSFYSRPNGVSMFTWNYSF